MERGLDICHAYYEAFGKPMLEKEFAEYADRIAVGLVGEGSDCFGYDDEISRDHDWGPGFCMWITKETYDEIGPKLQAAYDALPTEFRGYKRTVTDRGQNRRGVFTIDDFYRYFVGTAVYEEIDWRQVDEVSLAAATNGQVFTDPEGIFTAMREKLLEGYPMEIQFLKLAQEAALFSQNGQYNNMRMLQRGDTFTAKLMTAEACVHAMKLLHYLNKKYPPHNKWLRKSTESLEDGKELIQLLDAMTDSSGNMEAAQYYGKLLGSWFAESMYSMSYISDIDYYLDAHTDELCKKAGYSALTHEQLVEKIARTEFAAFDKVKNEGGRASCQNDWPTFSIMRKSQYMSWGNIMLMQYLYDFEREFAVGHNLITEKYGRMMESTAPEKYAEIAMHFPGEESDY